ncbi:hypothetical protein [Streptacidiphilus jiangxiensis]|uniref:Peptidase inhibitor family I36 n=1 Tax=Streptacidiphilus jiangxiensis TaxID=235985 RepID=A0A1H7LWE4_STRJI|nr:hypothetical protein [Streptacidiphilus jiangxiensis]SEL03264.1 hypothetical protein SAMN05414137_10569 [Streptacidiphilus jiangxiensis]
MKFRKTLALAAMLAAVPVVGVAGSAQASNCTSATSNGHCYAENQLEGNGSHPNAAGVDLDVNCLSVANRSTDFDDWEMWFATDTPQVSYDTWTEEGMTAGSLQGGYQGFLWYWADMRPNGTYNEHYIRNASVGTSTNVSVYYAGNDNDNVYLGGSLVGTSAGNGSGGLYANAGFESTTTAATLQGWADNFQYRVGSSWSWASPNVWNTNSGWVGTSASGSNLYASTGCGGGAAPLAAPAAHALPADAAQRARVLAQIVQGVATRAHGSHLGSARTTRSTRQQAIKALLGGDRVQGDQAVEVIQLNGDFSPVRSMKQRKAGALPTSNTLTILVDPATGRITDWGISNIGSAALAQLGPVSQLS